MLVVALEMKVHQTMWFLRESLAVQGGRKVVLYYQGGDQLVDQEYTLGCSEKWAE